MPCKGGKRVRQLRFLAATPAHTHTGPHATRGARRRGPACNWVLSNYGASAKQGAITAVLRACQLTTALLVDDQDRRRRGGGRAMTTERCVDKADVARTDARASRARGPARPLASLGLLAKLLGGMGAPIPAAAGSNSRLGDDIRHAELLPHLMQRLGEQAVINRVTSAAADLSQRVVSAAAAPAQGALLAARPASAALAALPTSAAFAALSAPSALAASAELAALSAALAAPSAALAAPSAPAAPAAPVAPRAATSASGLRLRGAGALPRAALLLTRLRILLASGGDAQMLPAGTRSHTADGVIALPAAARWAPPISHAQSDAVLRPGGGVAAGAYVVSARALQMSWRGAIPQEEQRLRGRSQGARAAAAALAALAATSTPSSPTVLPPAAAAPAPPAPAAPVRRPAPVVPAAPSAPPPAGAAPGRTRRRWRDTLTQSSYPGPVHRRKPSYRPARLLRTIAPTSPGYLRPLFASQWPPASPLDGIGVDACFASKDIGRQWGRGIKRVHRNRWAEGCSLRGDDGGTS